MHEAWGDERTFHMQNFKGQVSYWSDQGKLINTKLNFENAKLTTRAKELRKNWLDWDAETLEPSKIWRTVALGKRLRPVTDKRMHRLGRGTPLRTSSR